MQSQVSEISPVLVEVKVEIPWDRVQKDLDETYKELSRTAKVRGFRPGKVPPHVLRQMYGKQVRSQVSGSLIEQGLLHAVQEHEIAMIAKPEVDSSDVKKGEPFSFTAKVEVRPKLDRVDAEGLTLWRAKAEAKDSEVDDEIEQLRNQHADIRAPEPMRPAKKGDLLTIDFTVEVDGEEQPEMAASDRQVELGNEQLLKEFDKALSGAQPGDQKQITVEFPEDHGNESLQGKTATFDATIKDVHEKLLPEVDDEFAKDCGDFETLLELRLKIREQIEAMAQQQSDLSLRDQAVDALLEKNEVPVPPSMLQQQRQAMLYEMMQFMQMSGQSFSEGMMDGLDDRAERRVKAAILLGALARQEAIEVTETDLDAKFAEIAEQSGKHIAKVRAETQGEQRDRLESQLLEDKIMANLLDKATVKEGEPPKKAEGDKEAASADEGGKAKAATKKKTAAKKKAPAKKKSPTEDKG